MLHAVILFFLALFFQLNGIGYGACMGFPGISLFLPFPSLQKQGEHVCRSLCFTAATAAVWKGRKAMQNFLQNSKVSTRTVAAALLLFHNFLPFYVRDSYHTPPVWHRVRPQFVCIICNCNSALLTCFSVIVCCCCGFVPTMSPLHTHKKVAWIFSPAFLFSALPLLLSAFLANKVFMEGRSRCVYIPCMPCSCQHKCAFLTKTQTFPFVLTHRSLERYKTFGYILSYYPTNKPKLSLFSPLSILFPGVI